MIRSCRGTDLPRQTSETGQSRDVFRTGGRFILTPSASKWPVQPVNGMHDRVQELNQCGQRTGDPESDLPIVSYTGRLGENLGELQHQKVKMSEEGPDPLVTEESVELRTGYRGTDRVCCGVQHEDGCNGALDFRFETSPEPAGLWPLQGNLRNLAGRRLSRAASISEQNPEMISAPKTLPRNNHHIAAQPPRGPRRPDVRSALQSRSRRERMAPCRRNLRHSQVPCAPDEHSSLNSRSSILFLLAWKHCLDRVHREIGGANRLGVPFASEAVWIGSWLLLTLERRITESCSQNRWHPSGPERRNGFGSGLISGRENLSRIGVGNRLSFVKPFLEIFFYNPLEFGN